MKNKTAKCPFCKNRAYHIEFPRGPSGLIHLKCTKCGEGVFITVDEDELANLPQGLGFSGLVQSFMNRLGVV